MALVKGIYQHVVSGDRHDFEPAEVAISLPSIGLESLMTQIADLRRQTNAFFTARLKNAPTADEDFIATTQKQMEEVEESEDEEEGAEPAAKRPRPD